MNADTLGAFPAGGWRDDQRDGPSLLEPRAAWDVDPADEDQHWEPGLDYDPQQAEWGAEEPGWRGEDGNLYRSFDGGATWVLQDEEDEPPAQHGFPGGPAPGAGMPPAPPPGAPFMGSPTHQPSPMPGT